jgi:hypothetical protein
MSTSFTPSEDLMLQAKLPQVPALFTTFSAGSFIKPGQFTQPVKAVSPATFAGCYTEVYAAAPLDIDYEEPNAVTDEELELISTGGDLHQMELTVVDGLATNEIEAAPPRAAA